MNKLLYDLKHNNVQINDILSRKDINENDFYNQCALFFNITLIDLSKTDFDIVEHKRISFEYLEKNSLLIYKENNKTITLLSFDPTNNPTYEIISLSGKNVIFHLCRKSQMNKYLFKMKQNKEISVLANNHRFNNSNISNSDNIPKILSLLIENALDMGASDIHLEHKSNLASNVRYRIHNDLHKILKLENETFKALISIIKLNAKIDSFNTLSPQDGRFSLKVHNISYNFRVSFIPLYNGESIAIRILKPNNEWATLDSLKLPNYSTDIIKSKSLQSNSLILFTGPTGSGKTTTLYATLDEISSERKKIITIEDPVEYELKNIEQIQISKNETLSFSNILKSVLRHDPDIIMIGEIRDNKSLKLALQASLTGHLVFSTLHTKDAISAIVRLKEMGVEDYIILDSISCIHSSRLVKVLCSHCKIPYNPSKHITKKYNLQNETLYKKNGCENCQMTGYSSRISICETLDVFLVFGDNKIPTDYNTAYQDAIKHGFIPMIEHGISKVKNADINIYDLLNQIYIR